MLTLEHAGLEITVENDPTYTPRSADNVRRYDREISTCAARTFYSKHGVTARSPSKRYTAILLGCGGPTAIHAHTAVAHGGRLYVACGDAVCALTLPELAPAWICQADDATCFGVHPIPEETDLISHGELAIARISPDGEVVWRAWGRDIFTGECEVFGDRVRVVDWDGVLYEFAIADGRTLAPEAG